jgi:hypothetical protein
MSSSAEMDRLFEDFFRAPLVGGIALQQCAELAVSGGEGDR